MYSSSLYDSSSAASALTKSAGAAMDTAIWGIIALLVALVGGIVLYFTFLSKKNDGKFEGVLGWLYDTLTFKKMLLETVLKITYLIFAIWITLSSFTLIGTSFWGFVLMLVGGNVLVRVIYEFSLLTIVMCRNTTEINTYLKKKALKENNEVKAEVVKEEE